jgi:AhpD family alkylhydroperoxidase
MSARAPFARRRSEGDAIVARLQGITMKPRMQSPAMTLPGAMDALFAIGKAVEAGGIPRALIELCNLRASQINGCAVCLDMHARALSKLGEKPEKIATVAAFREAPYFSDAERAALALTEAETRLADTSDAVSDAVWEEAATHFEGKALAALVLSIAAINLWNRLNAATRQISGEWTAKYA